MRIGLVISLALAVLAVVFALQNPAPMDVDLGPFEFHGSTALILMITFSLGVLVGLLATLPGLLRRRKRVRELERLAGGHEPVRDASGLGSETHTARSDPWAE